MKLRLRITGPGLSTTYDIQPGTNWIGRKRRPTDPQDAREVQIVLDTPQVARIHARLESTSEACWIRDQGSEFGTRLNGRLLEPWTPTELKPGDTLVIGLDFTLVLEDLDVGVVATNRPERRVERKEQVPTPPPPDLVYYDGEVPPGLSRHSLRIMQYLPEVYQPNGNGRVHGLNGNSPDNSENFMARFLAIFESVLLPIEWTIVNFDLFLSAMTAPVEFMPWLESWFLITTDSSWSESQRRLLVAEADELFALRGTAKSMRRVIEIYTGVEPLIDDEDPSLPPHVFRIKVRQSEQFKDTDEQVIAALIDAFKPVHTTYIVG